MQFKSGKRSQAWAQSWIRRLVSEGWQNTRIVNWLREHNASYTNQLMFRDVNRTRLEQLAAQDIPKLKPELPVPINLMRIGFTRKPNPFSVVIHVDAFDTITGQSATRIYSLQFQEPPSQRDVLEVYEDKRALLQSGTDPRYVLGDVKKAEYYKNELPDAK